MSSFKLGSSNSWRVRGTEEAGIDFSFGLINVNSLSKQSTTSSATKYCSFQCRSSTFTGLRTGRDSFLFEYTDPPSGFFDDFEELFLTGLYLTQSFDGLASSWSNV